eukprot:9476237-Pyramimonas_sp.AAC.1
MRNIHVQNTSGVRLCLGSGRWQSPSQSPNKESIRGRRARAALPRRPRGAHEAGTRQSLGRPARRMRRPQAGNRRNLG